MKNKQDFDEHPLWDLVEQLINDADIAELPIDTRHYLKYLLNDLTKRREQINAYYVSKSAMDELRNLFQNIYNNRTSATYVDSYVDQAFEVLGSRFPVNNGRLAHDINKQTYDATMLEINSKLQEVRANIETIEELKECYQSYKDILEDNISEYEKSASKRIEGIANTAEVKTEGLFEELERKITTTQEKADAGIENVSTKYEEQLKELEETYRDNLEAMSEESSGLLEKVQRRSSSISGWVIADTYGKYARNQNIGAVIYDVLAIFFAIVGIGLVAFALTELHADETSATIFKFAVSVASFTIAGFLFKRGTFHQREAKAAKRTELTLRQYEAFIATLESKEQERITKEIADRIFIRGEIDDKTPTMTEALANRGLTDSQLKTLREILELLNSTTQSVGQ